MVGEDRRVRDQPQGRGGQEPQREPLESRVIEPLPEQDDGRALEGPADRDPFPLELQRDGDGGEGKRGRGEPDQPAQSRGCPARGARGAPRGRRPARPRRAAAAGARSPRPPAAPSRGPSSARTAPGRRGPRCARPTGRHSKAGAGAERPGGEQDDGDSLQEQGQEHARWRETERHRGPAPAEPEELHQGIRGPRRRGVEQRPRGDARAPSPRSRTRTIVPTAEASPRRARASPRTIVAATPWPTPMPRRRGVQIGRGIRSRAATAAA